MPDAAPNKTNTLRPHPYTIVFVDIEGSTKMTEALILKGDSLYETYLRDPVRDVLLTNVGDLRGKMLHSAGDGQMFYFEHPEDAITAMIRFQQALHTNPLSFKEPGTERYGQHESALAFTSPNFQ